MSDDDDRLYDDETPLPVKPRPKAKNLPQRASAPTVERSLERFIEEAKATPHAHDVSYFDAGTREEQLAKEVVELRKQLAAADQRATEAAARAAEPVKVEPADQRARVELEPVATRTRWGAVIAAFALGGVCMFGVTRLMREEPVTRVEAAASAPSAPLHAAVERAAPPAIAEPKPEPKPEPRRIEPKPDEPPPVVAIKPRPAVKNPIKKPAVAPPVKPVEAPVTPAAKPADPKPSDTGLYNPFGQQP